MVNANSVTILLGKSNADELDFTPENSKNTSIIVRVSEREDLSKSLHSHLPSSLKSIRIFVKSSDIPNLLDPLALAHLVPTLDPKDGLLRVQIMMASNEEASNLQIVNTAFLLAGLETQSEQKDIDSQSRILTAAPKSKSKSSSARINIQNNGLLSIHKQNEIIGNNDHDDLFIDEDELLLEGDNTSNVYLAPPPTIDIESRKALDNDCGGRKPCDDCTCGRADMLKQEKMLEEPTIPTSSCGNCSKGDAFRCAGCPYLGKPAFKAGEEHLVLDLMDDL